MNNVFSDDDLKRLKECVQMNGDHFTHDECLEIEKVKALIVRLEAAERKVYVKGFHEGQSGLYAEGFRAAQEKAAHIADHLRLLESEAEVKCGIAELIAGRIRGMKVG